MTTSPQETAAEETIWSATPTFLIVDYPAYVMSCEKARASFVASRYQILLEEHKAFKDADPTTPDFGPWLLQLEAKPDESGHTHYWWRHDNIRPVGISESQLWDELFPPGKEYATSADHFAAEFSKLLWQRGVSVILESGGHMRPLEFLPAL